MTERQIEVQRIETAIRDIIASRFDGVLSRGPYSPDGCVCILEVESVRLGLTRTHNPVQLRTFNLQPIDDIYVSKKLRIEWMPRIAATYAGSLDWPMDRQLAVSTRLSIGTVREVLPMLPSLPAEIASQCRTVKTIEQARAAAQAAWEMTQVAEPEGLVARATGAAAIAARAAQGTAEWVAGGRSATDSAAAAARVALAVAVAAWAKEAQEAIFVTVCNLWIEAANDQT